MSNYIIEEYLNMIKFIDKSKYRTRNEKNKRLTFQFYSKGNKYDGKFMVVGRAVNGWSKECEWIHGEYSDSSPREKVTEAYEKSLIDPLQWVYNSWGENGVDENGKKKYNTAKSPFWQLTKNVLMNLTPEDNWHEDSWALKIIWSNLYKVAPSSGGNPNNTLCSHQLDFCKRILRYEIEVNKPQYILFVTGENWFKDFFECITYSNEYRPKIYVSERPEFRSPSQMADIIYKGFTEL